MVSSRPPHPGRHSGYPLPLGRRRGIVKSYAGQDTSGDITVLRNRSFQGLCLFQASTLTAGSILSVRRALPLPATEDYVSVGHSGYPIFGKKCEP